MLEKAKSYPAQDQKRYLAAADRWRLPYWDYHRPRGDKVTFPGVVDEGTTEARYHVNLPLIFSAPSIMVHEPGKAELTPLQNPFVSFKFPKSGNKDRIPNDQWENVAGGSVRHIHVM
jgi:tyrosinase